MRPTCPRAGPFGGVDCRAYRVRRNTSSNADTEVRSMNYTEMPEPEQRRFRDQVLDQTEVLRRNVLSSGDQARKYLVLTNGGGAVALLVFMGNNPAVRNAYVFRPSLALFVLGVICVGLVAAFDYHSRADAFRVWLKLPTRGLHRGSVLFVVPSPPGIAGA